MRCRDPGVGFFPLQTVVMEIPEDPRAETVFLTGVPMLRRFCGLFWKCSRVRSEERGSLERLRLAVSPDLKLRPALTVGGGDLRITMERGLEHSRILSFCLPPQSSHTKAELLIQTSRDKGGGAGEHSRICSQTF